MINLQKASLSMNGNSVNLTMPISKIDEEKRIVSGFATLDNIDKQGDRILPEASEKAFANFRGNVRLCINLFQQERLFLLDQTLFSTQKQRSNIREYL
jgi:hypothetical protein